MCSFESARRQEEIVKGIVKADCMGTGKCVHRTKVSDKDGKELVICTCNIEPYLDVPFGCGWNYGNPCKYENDE